MSDYCHEFSIRFKPTKRELEMALKGKYDPNDPEAIFKLEDMYPDLFHGHKFSIEMTDQCTYVDYVLESSYGEECGDWIKARYLHEDEIEACVKLFSKLFNIDEKIVKNQCRIVDYCWYNCCEPPDCFEPTEDPFYRSIAKQIEEREG